MKIKLHTNETIIPLIILGIKNPALDSPLAKIFACKKYATIKAKMLLPKTVTTANLSVKTLHPGMPLL